MIWAMKQFQSEWSVSDQKLIKMDKDFEILDDSELVWCVILMDYSVSEVEKKIAIEGNRKQTETVTMY